MAWIAIAVTVTVAAIGMAIDVITAITERSIGSVAIAIAIADLAVGRRGIRIVWLRTGLEIGTP